MVDWSHLKYCHKTIEHQQDDHFYQIWSSISIRHKKYKVKHFLNLGKKEKRNWMVMNLCKIVKNNFANYHNDVNLIVLLDKNWLTDLLHFKCCLIVFDILLIS